MVQSMDIARGEYYRFKQMLEKVKKVYETKKYDRSLRVYDNRFNSNDGRDVAFVIGFDSWSFF